MERYELDVLYTTLQDFKTDLDAAVSSQGITMGISYSGI